MTQKNNRNYAEQITLGCLAINKPLSFVKTIFLNREQNENHYIFNAQKETSLEVRFESSTLMLIRFQQNVQRGISFPRRYNGTYSLYRLLQ